MRVANIAHHGGAWSVNDVAHCAITVFHLEIGISCIVDLQALVFWLNARLNVCLPGLGQQLRLVIGPLSQVVLLELDVLALALLVILTHMVAMADFVGPIGFDAVRAGQGGENGLQQTDRSCGYFK